MHRLPILIAAGLALLAVSGCQTTNNTEMPRNNGDGADFMRPSPCACLQLDYDGSGFEWLS